MEDLTIIIKTLDRYNCLKKLLKSVFKRYPKMKVLIGDDSEISSKDIILDQFKEYDIKYFNLPKDIGLSAGRNFLLKHVETKYFFLLDDDMEIDKKTDLEYAIKKINEEDLDILGGYCRNYKTINNKFDEILVFFERIFKYELPTNYIGSLSLDGDTFYAKYITREFPEYKVSDIVLNVFVAKTKSVLDMGGWDENLKLQEHTEFFYRTKLNNLKVAFTNKLSIQHHPVRLKGYKEKRGRNYTNIFMDKYNIKKIVNEYDDKRGKVIVKREKEF